MRTAQKLMFGAEIARIVFYSLVSIGLFYVIFVV